MYPTAGIEIIDYLSKSSRIKNVTEPLNTGNIRYYSVMNDGSSSAKTSDEKELFLIKTADSGSCFTTPVTSKSYKYVIY